MNTTKRLQFRVEKRIGKLPGKFCCHATTNNRVKGQTTIDRIRSIFVWQTFKGLTLFSCKGIQISAFYGYSHHTALQGLQIEYKTVGNRVNFSVNPLSFDRSFSIDSDKVVTYAHSPVIRTRRLLLSLRTSFEMKL